MNIWGDKEGMCHAKKTGAEDELNLGLEGVTSICNCPAWYWCGVNNVLVRAILNCRELRKDPSLKI